MEESRGARMRIPCRRYGTLIGLTVLWACMALPAPGSCADAMVLKGLPGFHVIADIVPPAAEHAGLTRQQLHTDVVTQLRQAGLAVLTSEDATRVPGAPILHVAVALAQESSTLYVFGITVDVNQQATLVYNVHNPQPRHVTTWHVNAIGTLPPVHLPNLRHYVRDLIGELLTAYFSVNPRSATRPAPSSAPRAP